MGTNSFLDYAWEGLVWGEWIPLDASAADFRLIPQDPGFYRVRVVGQPVLAYLGQTGRNLRARLGELRRPLYRSETEMPWNDPHTASQSLWTLRVAEGVSFECSAAISELDTQERQVFEDMLLWCYRVEKGESTLCNHGRFHPLYFRSSNRKQGRRGGLLPENEINPASSPSTKPLQIHGSAKDDDWMNLTWHPLGNILTADSVEIPKRSGVYKISDKRTKQLLYIGESSNIHNRLKNHSSKNWGAYLAEAAYHLVEETILPHQRHEIEADLIGAYYFQEKKVPVFQYVAHDKVLESP